MTIKFVGTHNGVLHSDEVFAMVTYMMATEPFVLGKHELIRTRKPEVLSMCHVLIDVGGEYDPQKDFFDHHQRGGAGRRSNGMEYASAGLVWLKYGEGVCKRILESIFGDEFNYKELAEVIDNDFISLVDARDVGAYKDITRVPTILDAISSLNEPWYLSSPAMESIAFDNAMQVAKVFLTAYIKKKAGELLARGKFLGMITGQVNNEVVLLNEFVPWTGLITEHSPETLFVVFPDISGSWRIQGAPVKSGSQKLKASLPEPWRGMSKELLIEASGVSTAMFCHPTGFIMGCEDMEDALICAFQAVYVHKKLLELGEIPQD
jgi:uncharacterized UPF0160 family protein